jgi:hypothetical protein
MKVPEGHVVHTAHEGALNALLKCPLGQAEQECWELEAALDTYDLGPHWATGPASPATGGPLSVGVLGVPSSAGPAVPHAYFRYRRVSLSCPHPVMDMTLELESLVTPLT